MRTVATFLAAATLSVAIAAAWPGMADAQQTIMMDGESGAVLDDGGPMPESSGACGCRDLHSPPWHGNVAGDPCGPSCPPPNKFHADPCGQLWLKHTARHQGYVLPPCFPRMHGRLADGWWPTPRPITLPRCPNCGMHIDPGM